MYVLNGQEFQGRVIVNLIRLKVCGSLSLTSDPSNICLFEGYIEMFLKYITCYITITIINQLKIDVCLGLLRATLILEC